MKTLRTLRIGPLSHLILLSIALAPGIVNGQTNSTIWPATATPALPDSGPDSAVELGIKFRADVSGSITAIRFYKGVGNTGTHTGSLWSTTGTRLATATFAGESGSGWQQVNLTTPVAITANTVYVASYHTNVGHYADDEGAFAAAGVDNPPLHALAAGVSGANGVYAYGASSTFPTGDWLSSNYWVDVVFSTTAVGDVTKPVVTAFTIPATSTSLTVPINSFTATDAVGVTGYILTTTTTAPLASAAGWTATAPTTYTFPTAGAKTLYAWAKDAAGNVSTALSALVTITLDTTRPVVTAFTIPATSNSLTVPINSFTATDAVGVTGYILTTTTTTPLASATGWTATAPTTYTFPTAGAKTLYAWAKDAAGNVSTRLSATVTITLGDVTKPVVTAFTIPASSTSLAVAIGSFTATDNVAVTGYILTEVATAPLASATGWTATAPATYTFASAGVKSLFAWAKDAAGNVSTSLSQPVTITLADTTKPVVTAFTMPATATSLTVAISSFTATDNVAVTGYILTTTATAPLASATGWTATAPTSFTFPSAGVKTLFAWAKDAANNVSTSLSASVTITLSTTGPESAGWFSGDIHVHRSCGGSPEAVSSLFSKMNPENLTIISLLADMGNAEVQNATTDLPLVNGLDASISTASRIVHWDTEWHWDATYTQYAHQALGGHLVALGLTQAQQVWQESTYQIFDWAHQRNAVAGFAHMQYLDGGIPQSLTCCTPIEYPVEVALGKADFISEDVDDNGSGFPMNPEAAMDGYYKLLNSGFRPGLAAGTDYPCNNSRPLGALLTYAEVAGGQLTYRNWIEAIRNGRTVVSRNGHREFLKLTVNGSATPGDEIQLAAAASIPVAVQWTATQNLSGTLELVVNGVVVASQQASVTAGSPVIWNTTAEFPKSGWLAVRRMGNDGHQVHTAAVFVIVNSLPIRASVADAQFFVQWMDNLLTKTDVGGAWRSFFPTNLANARARFQQAKAIYQQIALEAAGNEPPPDPSAPSIFTTQTPTGFENDAAYELGTRFFSDVSGQLTGVRLYTNDLEGGSHTVRIWRVTGGAVVGGPYTWNITSGTTGWKTFTLPAAVPISANTDYIVAISNSSDRYYAEQNSGLGAAIVSGHLHTYSGSGVYATTVGVMPTLTWQNTNYFRDIIFAAQ